MIANIVLTFFRIIGRFFSRLFTRSRHFSRTGGKAGTGAAARKIAPRDQTAQEQQNPPADNEFPPREHVGFETFFFEQRARPRLSERNAAELSLEEARLHLKQADIFYRFPFPLFARSDFFYEQVEEEYLSTSLGLKANSIDTRFLQIMDLFRKTLNKNTRHLMMTLAPIILILSLALGVMLMPLANSIVVDNPTVLTMIPLPTQTFTSILSFSLSSLIGVLLIQFIFSWPFKVVQQRNLLNLDNYLTSKFGRINNNFQVAKRRALNVERDKRMNQQDELKDEAGVWTLSYQWFGVRLLLCELMIRNKLYQVRRNTILYWLGGLLVNFVLIGLALALTQTALSKLGINLWGPFTGGIIYLTLTYAGLQRTTRILSDVLGANEWSRFHLLNLPKTIQDHVGEDKVQIVTFRDRNRME